jgi:hypothetical protein
LASDFCSERGWEPFFIFTKRGILMIRLDERFERVIDLMEARRVDVGDVLFQLEGIDYAICGGVAVSYWVTGRKPTLRELDLLIREEDLEELRDRLREIGCRVGGYGGVDLTAVVVNCGSLQVDLIVAEKAWEQDGLDMAVRVGDVRVLRPEFLIMMKLESAREKDVEDIILLLGKVNFEKLRKMVKDYMGIHYVEELEALKEISGKMAQRFSAGRLKKFLKK